MGGSIFLSASVPEIGRSKYYETADPLLILAAVRALTTVVLGRKRIVWGGHPAITPILMESCEEMNVAYGDFVTLYQSNFFKEEFPEENAFFKNVIFTSNIGNNENASLAHMRKEMLKRSDLEAAVFIGGMEGTEIESKIFRKYHPDANCIFVASTGGAAQIMALEAGLPGTEINNIDYITLFHNELKIPLSKPKNTIKPFTPQSKNKTSASPDLPLDSWYEIEPIAIIEAFETGPSPVDFTEAALAEADLFELNESAPNDELNESEADEYDMDDPDAESPGRPGR